MSRWYWRHFSRLVALVVLLCLYLAFPSSVRADVIDSLEQMLTEKAQVQEKVYVHTDNNCYFIGDTIWYKAYVLRADNLRPTDMSKLLYVELLSPDGLVVERQRIVVSDKGFTCGQFALKDSLYSGYYELRAYTRWMLNFNVAERPYTVDDRRRFYSNQMAKDYFRDWEDLYSRVLPVYSKPQTAGDYAGKYMYGRPKMEMAWTPKKELHCNFYPEGGMLVQGLASRVAFELTDQDGKAVELSGVLGEQQVSTAYMGRGVFSYTPGNDDRDRLTFHWNGDDYTFKLPRAETSGAVITFSEPPAEGQVWQVNIQRRGCEPVAYALLCRGRLCGIERLHGATSFGIDLAKLPSGVNELQLYDAEGNVLADRLFFVNHNDRHVALQVQTDKEDYLPYEAINLSLKAVSGVGNMPVSVSVRDSRTDDLSFDDGNMLTDMLLSSDLKGFIASPSYYFERNDAVHRQALDLLMLVQGWRKYAVFDKSRHQIGWGKPILAPLRYSPEKTLTIEGTVNKQLDVPLLQLTDVAALNNIPSVADAELERAENAVTVGNIGQYGVNVGTGTSEDLLEASTPTDEQTPTDIDDTDVPHHGVNHGSLNHEVLVEAEITKDGQVAGLIQKTRHGGRFSFQIPPFYDEAVLFITAYEEKDSARRALSSRTDKHRMDEEWYSDFYVKRDLFYPVFARPYSYYQTHLPELLLPSALLEGGAEEGNMQGDHTLNTVKVEAKRRSRRAADYTKPAYVVDAYELYNEATERGLSWGLANMGTFPPIACLTVYGNMNRKRDYNVLGKLDNYTFYQNFSSTIESVKNRSESSVFNDLHLRRIRNFRFYTDYEPRNYQNPHTEQLNVEDVTVVYELIPDQGKRYTYRDRRYILPGLAYPEQHYSPDYSKLRPVAPADYRRTLYWNPNAMLDAHGEFHATLYNNSKETRVKVSVSGVSADGKFLTQE